ncbi:hypothetical protein BJ742DRAFT_824622 [Cladochytrium replicatum]|nr:hypothetical protein BJ742DRAFT_824622 [Cladochytrium replicatum]
MQIRHLKSIVAPSETFSRIQSLAWSSNNQKLAVVGADRVIQLYDETGERKDRFATKAADPKTTGKYVVTAIAFSPDATRLAIAQSDCAVFVYKLGLEWGEKKSICNKLIQTSEITCLTWPKEQNNALVFGMADGKVRVGNLKTNKAATLYQTDSCVVSCASSLDGNAVITGHLDGSINRFFFDDGVTGASQGKFASHKCAPYALAWGEQIVVAGNDKIVTFYDHDGRIAQEFNYSRDEDERDFTTAEMNPSGQSVVLGSYNRFRIFNYSSHRGQWEEAPVKIIENFYSVTALAWKPDGSRLVGGNIAGAVELFDCCLRRSRYKGKFEFTYVSGSQVIVKRLSTGSRIVLKSHYGYEIQKVNIFQDQYLVAHTPETLLMGDLASCKLSEIPWTGGGNERFYFDHPQICMVFNAGEMTLVEYGVNEILGSVRTEYINPHLISVRLNERHSDTRRIAYLIDQQTIHVMNLVNGSVVATVNHDTRVDWLELSGKGNRLLYRDKRRQLHLYEIATQTHTTLLNLCSYVQWVPNSDVVVAQNRSNLCIWYTMDSPERVTMVPIKGDIEDIERANGKTEVIVDEGVNTVSYALDESLIEFGTALDDKDFERAITLLETLEITSETEAMWKSLGQLALQNQKLLIAERCFVATGDIARARYLRQLNEMIYDAEMEGMEVEDFIIQARLAVLDKQFKLAETIYLEHGKVEEAMKIYQEVHKWDLSIKVAELKNHPELANLKRNYFQWLLESGQEDKAAHMKEEEADYIGAVNLYLRGGMPGRAAFLLNSQASLGGNTELTEKIATAAFNSGLFEKAGELYERLGNSDRALDSYKRGKAFRAAVELSRTAYPHQVVSLEEQWGDYLVSQKQMDAAINHFIEAGQSVKAIESAIAAKQWKKAVGIVDSFQPPEKGKPYFLQLAQHFREAGELANAEKYYVLAGKPNDAVEMYTTSKKWEKAHALASSFMSQEEVAILYISQARELEAQGNLKEAERLYLTVGEPDLAINMYRQHKHYDHMIRLVTAHHKDLLLETHLYLAKTLETDGNLKQSEHHYIEGKDWKSAINMYCANSMYEEAYRIGKAYGGPNSAKQVAYLWARSLGGESAVKLLTKFGLLDAAIDFATENGHFDFAFELSRFADKAKLADVHYKHAMFLEDDGKFKEAEAAFILAGKPKEAILMYMHNESWDEALSIAETYDPGSVPEVLVGQAKATFEAKDFARGETLLLRAQRPDIAVRFYKDAGMWKEAIRFTKEYLPNKLTDLHDEHERFLAMQASGSRSSTIGSKEEAMRAAREDIVSTARLLEQQKDHSRAIDLYLKLTSAHLSDLDKLEEYWERAVELAAKFVPDRGHEVVSNVCKRLMDVQRFEHAAEMYVGVDMFKEGIDAYLAAGKWEKAREVVANYAPSWNEYVEKAYVSHLKSQGKADALVGVDVVAALDLHSQRGDWEKCLDVASKQSDDLLNKYLMMFCVGCINEARYDQATETIVRYGVPSAKENYDVYARLARELLNHGGKENLSALREMLFKIVHGSTFTPQSGVPQQFSTLLMICHLITLRNHCQKKQDLIYFAAKQSISLLRYTNEIPPDRTFYQAGQYAKAAGFNNMAFVCWNRFLDITDAIEEGESALLENADFANTDVPYDVELHASDFDMNKEEVRDWVLQMSLDRKVNQEVDRRNCDDCNTRIYDAALVCFNCHTTSEACIVTGYPVLRSKVKCPTCNRAANKEDWNKFILSERVCPWCGTQQQPSFNIY